MTFNQPNGHLQQTSQPEPALSIDQSRLLVFIVWSARVVLWMQKLLSEKRLPKDERVPPLLLKRLIRQSLKLVPWWAMPAKKIPTSGAKLGTELFFAITAIRLSQADIWRAGHRDFVDILDEIYSQLYDLGIKVRQKKRPKSDPSEMNVA